MRNRNLFLTLSEIAAAVREARPIATVPELGAAGTTLGIACAQDEGLASEFFGTIDLTPEGEAFARAELARFQALVDRVLS